MSEDVGPGNDASKLVHLSVVGKRYWRTEVVRYSALNTVEIHNGIMLDFYIGREGLEVERRGREGSWSMQPNCLRRP